MHWKRTSSARYLTSKTLRQPCDLSQTETRGTAQSFSTNSSSLPHLSHPLAAGITPVTRWSSGHNSTVSIESCTAGLPPVFGRACASFIFRHAGLGSSATTLNSKATLIARDLGSVLAAYLLCYHMMGLYLCYCIFNFQGSEEGHRNVPSLGRQRERDFCARFSKKFQNIFRCPS